MTSGSSIYTPRFPCLFMSHLSQSSQLLGVLHVHFHSLPSTHWHHCAVESSILVTIWYQWQRHGAAWSAYISFTSLHSSRDCGFNRIRMRDSAYSTICAAFRWHWDAMWSGFFFFWAYKLCGRGNPARICATPRPLVVWKKVGVRDTASQPPCAISTISSHAIPWQSPTDLKTCVLCSRPDLSSSP